MNELHTSECATNTERNSRLCNRLTTALELAGTFALVMAGYDVVGLAANTLQLDMDMAEQYAATGGLWTLGGAALWAVGMATIPTLKGRINARIHRRTDCAWDDVWETEGGTKL